MSKSTKEDNLENGIIKNNASNKIREELIRATAAPADERTIQKLINSQGANPFVTDEFGNSAFSVALRDGNPKLAKWFIENQKPELWKDISPNLTDDKAFCEYVAKELGKKESTLSQQLFDSDIQAVKVCFAEVLECYKVLGQDSDSLLEHYSLA